MKTKEQKRELTTLDHEVGDDAMEDGVLEVEGLAGLAEALLTSALRKKGRQVGGKVGR
jgi:hypothetical protein